MKSLLLYWFKVQASKFMRKELIPLYDADTIKQILSGYWQRYQRLKVEVPAMPTLGGSEHPHGFNDKDFDMLFTKDKPIIFAFHGYPSLIHRLTYRRTNHKNLHVRGYKGEGTTTTPFDMVVLNNLDRFHLVDDVIDRLPHLGSTVAYIKQYLRNKLLDHKAYIETHGEDMPEILNWKWNLVS